MPTPTPLTDEQIGTLFKFVKSKYVDFYDVQIELVDHLASEVEQRMAEAPGVTFDAALQQVYRGFGIFGFSDLVEEKQKAVNKQSRVLWWESVKHLFRLPMLIGSLIGGMIVFVGFDSLNPVTFVHTNAVLSCLAVIGIVVYFFKTSPSKKYKLTPLQYSGALYCWNLIHFHPIYFVSKGFIDYYPPEVYSVLVPLLCWASWIGFTASALGYKKLTEECRKQFPLAFA